MRSMQRQPTVYIVTNAYNRVLYTGVTSTPAQRFYQHRHSLLEGFTKRYNCTKLVYAESCDTMEQAITRKANQGLAAPKEDCAHREHKPAMEGFIRRNGCVVLSVAKDLMQWREVLRYAQDDGKRSSVNDIDKHIPLNSIFL